MGRRPCRALSRGGADGRAAAARSAGPLPQVGGTRRYAKVYARGCKVRVWPVLRAGHPLAAQYHSQGRACGASVAAQPQTLEQ
jgi:hypothetical protein